MIPIGDDTASHRRPAVTVAIIAACTSVFLWQQSLGMAAQQRAALGLGMIPAVVLGNVDLPPALAIVPPAATLVTSMFLHGGWGHLVGNLLYLWIFANNVEGRLGHLGFALFYLGCGAVAAGAQILPEPGSTLPMIGASGAVSGVLGAYLVLFPRASIIVLVPFSPMFIHRIQALWLLLIWFALQIFSGLTGVAGDGGVAWWAHVGGFVTGMAVGRLLPPPALPKRSGPWG